MSRSKVKVNNSETQNLINAAIAQGWKVDYTRGGHIVFWPKDKKFSPIYVAATSSDWRAVKNQTSRLKKAGLQI